MCPCASFCVFTEPAENLQCVHSEDAARKCNMKLVDDEWEQLTTKSSEQHEKLEEANRQRMYNNTREAPGRFHREVCYFEKFFLNPKFKMRLLHFEGSISKFSS